METRKWGAKHQAIHIPTDHYRYGIQYVPYPPTTGQRPVLVYARPAPAVSQRARPLARSVLSYAASTRVDYTALPGRAWAHTRICGALLHTKRCDVQWHVQGSPLRSLLAGGL